MGPAWPRGSFRGRPGPCLTGEALRAAADPWEHCPGHTSSRKPACLVPCWVPRAEDRACKPWRRLLNEWPGGWFRRAALSSEEPLLPWGLGAELGEAALPSESGYSCGNMPPCSWVLGTPLPEPHPEPNTPPTPWRENHPGPSAACSLRYEEHCPGRTWSEVCGAAFPPKPLNFILGLHWADREPGTEASPLSTAEQGDPSVRLSASRARSSRAPLVVLYLDASNAGLPGTCLHRRAERVELSIRGPDLPPETGCVAAGKSPRLSGAQGMVPSPGSLPGL